jgi:hypothetical protein
MQNAWSRPSGTADTEQSDVGQRQAPIPSTGAEGAAAPGSHGGDTVPDAGIASSGRSPMSGEHPVAGGPAGQDVPGEDEAHRTAVDSVDGLLDEVERALARLDDGTYGRCEACGEPIDDRRLAEFPVTRNCSRAECDPATEPVVSAPA